MLYLILLVFFFYSIPGSYLKYDYLIFIFYIYLVCHDLLEIYRQFFDGNDRSPNPCFYFLINFYCSNKFKIYYNLLSFFL